MFKSTFLTVLLGIFSFTVFAVESFAQSTSTDHSTVTLPGGSTSVQETFNKWVVTCSVANNTKICTLIHQQRQPGGQRVFAIEVTPETNTTRLTAVLPFGLLVSEGITYQIGSNSVVVPVKIKTCFAGGCIATFTLKDDEFKPLRDNTDMIIKAKVENNADDVAFTVPYEALGPAYDRLMQLLK